MNLLRKLLKEKETKDNAEMMFELQNSVGITLNADESNLNITSEEKEELKKLRQEAIELSKEVEEKLKNIE